MCATALGACGSYQITIVPDCCYFRARVVGPDGAVHFTPIARYGRYTARRDAERLIASLKANQVGRTTLEGRSE